MNCAVLARREAANLSLASESVKETPLLHEIYMLISQMAISPFSTEQMTWKIKD